MKMQSGFSAKKLLPPLIVLGLITAAAFLFLEEEQPTVSVKKVAKMKNVAKTVAASYGSRGTDTSWPAMPSDAVATANNLLAKNYMFVLDASGSMAKGDCTDRVSKMAEAKSAILAFGESLEADANIGLLAFSGANIKIVQPLSPYRKAALEDALQAIRPEGSTPLADAIDLGFKSLNEQAITQLGNGGYHLVVVTDGVADKGQNVLRSVERVIATSPVMIHAIGFCIGTNHALNQTGLTRYVAASDGATLREGLQAVLAEAPAFDASAFSVVP